MYRDRGSHGIYNLTYQYLCLVKDNKNILVGTVLDDLIEINQQLANTANITLKHLEVKDNYEYIIFSCSPKTMVSKVINALKGNSSRMLFRKHTKLKEEMDGTLWSNRYFITTHATKYEFDNLMQMAMDSEAEKKAY